MKNKRLAILCFFLFIAVVAVFAKNMQGLSLPGDGTLRLPFGVTVSTEAGFGTLYSDSNNDVLWKAHNGTVTKLSTVIGTDVMGFDEQLNDVAQVTPTDNSVLSGDGANLGMETFDSLLDAIYGNTRGAGLFRGVAGWALLVPGAAGTTITSNGVGADPTYQAGGAGDLMSDGTVPLTANWDVGTFKITANQFASDVATGTAPLVIASTTVVTNLNADTLDGVSSLAFVKADGSVPLTADWDAGTFEIRANTLESDVATGTAPFTIASTTVSTNLNADLLDGISSAAFLQNVVEDTTPQLGGTLDANNNLIRAAVGSVATPGITFGLVDTDTGISWRNIGGGQNRIVFSEDGQIIAEIAEGGFLIKGPSIGLYEDSEDDESAPAFYFDDGDINFAGLTGQPSLDDPGNPMPMMFSLSDAAWDADGAGIGVVTSMVGVMSIVGQDKNYDGGQLRLYKLHSTVLTAEGAPFTVASTTVSTNLNADLLDGQTGSYYQTQGTNLDGISAITSMGRGSILVWNGDAWQHVPIGTDNQVLTVALEVENEFQWEAPAAGGIANVVEDLSPQAGGDFDFGAQQALFGSALGTDLDVGFKRSGTGIVDVTDGASGLASLNIAAGTSVIPTLLFGDADTGINGYSAGRIGIVINGAYSGEFRNTGWLGNVTGTTIAVSGNSQAMNSVGFGLSSAGAVYWSSTGAWSGTADVVFERIEDSVLGLYGEIGNTTPAALMQGVWVEAVAGANSPADTESSRIFTNEGATGESVETLPTAVTGIEYTFHCQDVDGLKITAAASDTIALDGSTSIAAGSIATIESGASCTLVSINATEWVATSFHGDWTIDDVPVVDAYGSFYVTGNAVATAIGASPVRVDGTSTAGACRGWTATKQRLTYNGTHAKTFLVTWTASMDNSAGTASTVSTMYIALDGSPITGADVDRFIANTVEVGAGAVAFIVENVTNGQYLEPYISSDDEDDVTITKGSFSVIPASSH